LHIEERANFKAFDGITHATGVCVYDDSEIPRETVLARVLLLSEPSSRTVSDVAAAISARLDRRPGHAMTEAVRDVGHELRCDPRPSGHRDSAGTGASRRAESSMPIELAWVSPPSVSGTRPAIQPTSPCAHQIVSMIVRRRHGERGDAEHR
jgi:hypothetical protein